MEESVYSKLPKLKIEINLTTLVVGVLVLIFAFIIPVSLWQNIPRYNSEQPSSGGQVAGVNTSKEEQIFIIPVINQKVVLEGQSGILIILGLVLLVLCFLIITYIIIDSLRKHKKH